MYTFGGAFFLFCLGKINDMWHVNFEFGIKTGGGFVLKSFDVDEGLKAHLFHGSYNRSKCEFVIVNFYASQVTEDFRLLYRCFLNFSPSLDKQSNVDNVMFEESGKKNYAGDSSAKNIIYLGNKQRLIELKQSANHPLTSVYNVDFDKIYKIPIAMLTDLDDINSKFEFIIDYDLRFESEVIEIRFEFVK